VRPAAFEWVEYASTDLALPLRVDLVGIEECDLEWRLGLGGTCIGATRIICPTIFGTAQVWGRPPTVCRIHGKIRASRIRAFRSVPGRTGIGGAAGCGSEREACKQELDSNRGHGVGIPTKSCSFLTMRRFVLPDPG
jgi:hypothetical protein